MLRVLFATVQRPGCRWRQDGRIGPSAVGWREPRAFCQLAGRGPHTIIHPGDVSGLTGVRVRAMWGW